MNIKIRLMLVLAAALLLCTPPASAQMNVHEFLNAQTTTTSACSAARAVNSKSWSPNRTFMASGTTGSGAGAATIIIYGSDLGTTTWVALGTITLTLATTITFGLSTDAFSILAPWAFTCAHVSAISGTGASVSVSGSSQ